MTNQVIPVPVVTGVQHDWYRPTLAVNSNGEPVHSWLTCKKCGAQCCGGRSLSFFRPSSREEWSRSVPGCK